MAKSAARIQFLSDILSTAIEGGIDYWAQFDSIEKVDDANDIIGWRYESAVIYDYDDPDEKFVINNDVVAKGLNMIIRRNADRDKALILCSKTNGADGDFDADDADKIIQFALFDGDLMYG